MRKTVRAELDHIDELKVGQGVLEAFVFGTGDRDQGRLGGALEYSQRISEGWSAFGRASAGIGWGDRTGLEVDALAGLRWTGRGL